MSVRTRQATGALLGLLLLPLVLAAENRPLRLRVSLEPPVLGLGEVGRLVIEVGGSGLQGPQVSPRFELDNLELVSSASYGQQVSMGSGGTSWQRTWSWPVRGTAVGKARVFGVSLAGTQPPVSAESIEIDVVAERPQRPPTRRSPTLDEVEKLLGRSFPDPSLDRRRRPESNPTAQVLLRTTIDETRPYVGQTVRMTTWIYTQAAVQRLEKVGVPTFEGLWAENVEVDPVAEQESVVWQGEVWRRAPIDRRVLQALKSGPLTIGPTQVQVLSQQVERDPIFFRPVLVPREFQVASDPLHLEVRPLPAVPPELTVPFSGAVGRLQLRAHVVPNRLEVGHGASLTVTASGPGATAGVAPPRLDLGRGFRVANAPAASPGRDERGRSWSFVIVPEVAGEGALLPIEMAYFDPDSERYEVARVEVAPLEVRAAAAPPPAPAALAEDLPATRGLPLVLPWAVGGPAVLGLALFALHRRRRSGRGLAGGVSPAAAGEFAAALDRAQAEDRPRRAAREIEAAWRDLLAATPDGPRDAAPTDWSDELTRRGASPALVMEVEHLVGDLAYLRHAPELATTSALVAELARRSLCIARRIAREF